MNKKIQNPSSILIETVAAQLAATWYEIGRGQGLTSKSKDAKEYARTNLEKFIPKAIDHLLDILNNPYASTEMKEMIYDALQERVNDPTNVTSTDIKGLPPLDINKVLSMLPKQLPSQALKLKREEPINIKTRLNSETAIGKVNG
jgi:hypothetical protein